MKKCDVTTNQKEADMWRRLGLRGVTNVGGHQEGTNALRQLERGRRQRGASSMIDCCSAMMLSAVA